MLLLAIIITCVLPFVNNKIGDIDNLSELRWEQSYLCLCAGPGEASDYHKRRVICRTTYLSSSESYWRQTSVYSPRETCRYAASHLPLGVTNEGREAIIISRVSSKFLAPLPGTPSAKIGELATTFYLCFLVLLIYLSFFYLCVLYKKSQMFYLS